MKTIAFICFFTLATISAFAGEIPNTVGAVKAAKPGDYIVLKDGSRYVLVEEEIAIVNGTFDYSEVKALKKNGVPRSDGGVEFNITASHKRIVWSDGKSMDVFTTRRAFDAYIKFLEEQYELIPFINNGDYVSDFYPTKVPEGLKSFRGKVYWTFLTNDVETFDYIEAKEFNRTTIGDGIERNFQIKGGNIVTLGGSGNLSESGMRRDE